MGNVLSLKISDLHPLVRDASSKLFRERHYRQAVSEAMLALQTKIREQASLPGLDGDKLMGPAFGGDSPRIVVADLNTESGKNLQRGTQFIAQGLVASIRNPFAHEPIDLEPIEALEMLAAMSLVARRLSIAESLDLRQIPQIVAAHDDGRESIELLVTAVPADLKVLSGESDLSILRRTENTIEVEVPPNVAHLSLRLKLGGRVGTPFAFDRIPASAQDRMPFHQVEVPAVPVFASDVADRPLPVKAVRLKSYEGGRPFIREFPTQRNYVAGDYVTWDWDFAQVVRSPGWVGQRGSRRKAWDSSTYFAGTLNGKGGVIKLSRIEIVPSVIELRPCGRSPIRVIGIMTDGFRTWREDLTSQANLGLKDPAIALVAGSAVEGLKQGATLVTAKVESHFSQARVLVASLPTGKVVDYIGGLAVPSSICRAPQGLLIADRRDSVFCLKPDMNLDSLAVIDVPDTYSIGVDLVAADVSGNIYLRTLWDNSVRRLDNSVGLNRSTRRAIPRDGGTIMTLCWTTWAGLLVADHLGRIWRWDGVGDLEPWIDIPVAPIAMAASDDLVWVLGGQSRPGLVGVSSGGTIQQTIPTENIDASPSCLLYEGHDIVLAGFHSGRLYSLSGGKTRVLAEGFVNPSSITEDDEGGLLVANSGRDTISRVLP